MPVVGVRVYAQTQTKNAILREEMLRLCYRGHKVKAALKAVGRSIGWYNAQRQENPQWALEVSRAGGRVFSSRLADEARRLGAERLPESIREVEFPYFCGRYLRQQLFRHQLQWWDMLEGREPRELHPAMTYERREPNYMLINTPPNHAKSTTITVNWVTFLICTQPNVRITVVSKTADMAKTFIYAVQQRLTHPRYKDLQLRFAPTEGFKAAADMWRSDRIYVGGEARDSGEKDPTLQGIGIGQQIFGSRGDWYILDDCVTLDNAHEFEKQYRWLSQEVLTRPGFGQGRLAIVGTRVAPQDLYSELRAPERYAEGTSPWTYLSQPAVLEFAEKPEDWHTLWPLSNEPWTPGQAPPKEGELFARWDGPALARQRSLVGARTWSFVYQQENHASDAVFTVELVNRAQNGMRSPGRMHAGAVGYRPKGMEGLFVVCGVDPAMAGDTAMVVVGLDRFNGRRYVLDAKVKTAASPSWIRETIKQLAADLSVNEFRIEKNAFQIMLTQDPELHRHLASRGVTIVEHFTGKNKWDHDFGIGAMSLLFQNGLIELPNSTKSEAIRQLMAQLVQWAPQLPKQVKTDLVMALWFAEIKCRELMQASNTGDLIKGFLPNRFLSRRRRQQQFLVNVTDLAAREAG